jgi:hypothetical protein
MKQLKRQKVHKIIPSLLMAMTLFTLAVVALAGCQNHTSTVPVGTGSTNEATVSTPAPIPMPEQASDSHTVTEQDSPYGPGSTSSQTVGTIIDGLQLLDIRWGDHDSYFRVVFDMGTSDGQPVLQIPHAEASLEEGGTKIKVLLSGVRSISHNPNAEATNLSVGNDLVTSIERFPTYDDQLLGFTINLSRPATFSLAGLGSPGRIVIDIVKS